MSRWNSTTIIAGIDFSHCRVVIIGGHKFATDYAGSSVPASDLTPHVQRFLRGVKGKKFAASMETADAALVVAALAAIRAAEAASTPFVVHMVNSLYNINVLAWPDYNRGEDWVSSGEESEGIIDNVTMGFEAVALNIV